MGVTLQPPLTKTFRAPFGDSFAVDVNTSFNFSGSLPKGITLSRSTSGTYFDNTGTRQVAAPNQPRFDYDPVTLQPLGLLIESTRTNFLLNSLAPVTQTTGSLAVGTYVLWIEGSGTATSSAGTAVGSGFGAATAGSINTIVITTAGTVTVTLTGTVTAFQLEGIGTTGAFSSSLIITTGAAGTRSADVVTGSPITWYNQPEGTFVVQSMTRGVPTGNNIFRVSEATLETNMIAGAYFNNRTNALVVSGGVNQADINASGVVEIPLVMHRLAISYKANEFIASFDGGTAVTDISGAVPVNPTTLFLGRRTNTVASMLDGWIQFLTYYPTASSAAQLQTYSQPMNVVQPVASIQSGSGYAGSTYSSTTGIWTASNLLSYTYQWTANGVAISGATSSTYVMEAAYEGQAIACIVTGTSGSLVQNIASNSISLYAPRQTAGLVLHLDASDLATITKDGSNVVSQWNDKSGNANNFTSLLTAKRPTWVSADLSGLPTISFTDTANNATASGMQAANSTAYAEETVFAVVNMGTLVGTGDTILGQSVNNNYAFGVQTSTTSAWNTTSGVAGAGLSTSGNLKSDISQWITISGRRSAVIGLINLYENGALLGQASHTVGAMPSDKYRLGYDQRNNNATMKIAELLVFSRYLSNAEKTTIDDYLAAKWAHYSNPVGLRNRNRSVQLYYARNGLTALSSLPTRCKGIGQGGQSNSVGQGQNTSLSPTLAAAITNAFIWNNGATAFQTLQAGVNNVSNANQHGCELSLMYDMVADFGPTYMIKFAVNSTNLAVYWNPDGGTGYGNLMFQIQAALDKAGFTNGQQIDMVLFAWLQGEADADVADYTSAYESNLRKIISRFRAEGENCSSVVWAVNRIRYDSAANPSQVAQVLAAQEKVAASDPTVKLFGPWATSNGDGLHANSASQVELGNQAAIIGGATTQIS